MESFKIAVTCILAAVLYGIVHDQVTARICIEYFTVFHPPIFRTQSPTLLGIAWGIIATWWVGVFFAIPLILAARAGSRPVLRASALIPSVGLLLAFMAVSAVVFGVTGYVLARSGVLATDWLSFSPSPAMRYRFMADWWAHSASYASAFIGGTALCVMTYRRRLRLGSETIEGVAQGTLETFEGIGRPGQ
jgi:hypothetical protein